MLYPRSNYITLPSFTIYNPIVLCLTTSVDQVFARSVFQYLTVHVSGTMIKTRAYHIQKTNQKDPWHAGMHAVGLHLSDHPIGVLLNLLKGRAHKAHS